MLLWRLLHGWILKVHLLLRFTGSAWFFGLVPTARSLFKMDCDSFGGTFGDLQWMGLGLNHLLAKEGCIKDVCDDSFISGLDCVIKRARRGEGAF